nr:MAG TPA: hypothetical protein [Caudoviricetes sp.]
MPRARPRPLDDRAMWSGRSLVCSLTYRLATQLKATAHPLSQSLSHTQPLPLTYR